MTAKARFKFKTQVRVRNYEVDWQGIVHNANFLLYFEVGRIDYLQHLGIKVDLNSIQHTSKVVLVRNEINYRSPARFDELLNIRTRMMYIKNTSFAFEAYIEEATTLRPVADNIAVHVWLDPRNGEPVTVQDDFKNIIQKFEGSDLTIIIPPQVT